MGEKFLLAGLLIRNPTKALVLYAIKDVEAGLLRLLRGTPRAQTAPQTPSATHTAGSWQNMRRHWPFSTGQTYHRTGGDGGKNRRRRRTVGVASRR